MTKSQSELLEDRENSLAKSEGDCPESIPDSLTPFQFIGCDPLPWRERRRLRFLLCNRVTIIRNPSIIGRINAKTKMKRTKDYTSDAVKESVQAAMAKIKAYFDKNWSHGKEYNVIKHIHGLLDAEIDKYVAPGEAGNAYRHLAGYAPGSKKYDAVYAKNLEKYGPYLMELFVEYADSLKLTGRYDVGERYHEVSDDILNKMQKNLFSKKDIEQMIDTESEAIAKFMKQHGVVDYSITAGTIGLAVNVNDDITLTKKDAPRGMFRHEFGKVSGSFICCDCDLKSLLFGPKETLTAPIISCHLHSILGMPPKLSAVIFTGEGMRGR